MAPPPQPKRRRVGRNSRSPPSSDDSCLKQLLQSVQATSDPSVPLHLSLERILESRVLESGKKKLINVALQLGSALIDAANRSARKLDTEHNSIVWPLPPELTIKVFSCLDTTSLCYASATCTTFSKCAKDPLCYSHIDLTNGPKVTNAVVCRMIQRAGKNLKSLKIGIEFNPDGNLTQCLLTRTCLAILSFTKRPFGAHLQKLRLSHIFYLDTITLIKALSSCKSLVDLEIVALDVDLGETLKAVSVHCTSIERLCCDYFDFAELLVLDGSSYDGLIKNCNKLMSLSIIGCLVVDNILSELFKGLIKLKHVDFSNSVELTGSFLSDFGKGNGGAGDFLETLILKDCPDLDIDEMDNFLTAVIDGKWKSLTLLDISSTRRNCFECTDEGSRLLKEKRPEIHLIDEFQKRENLGPIELSCSSDTSTSISSFSTGGYPTLAASSSSSSSGFSFHPVASSSSFSDDSTLDDEST
ncbi:hypothetical protein LUZ60_006342 [Juncus effusus]|nr:hypothetical protein LUZ60_006342 [Juncus effusus]